MSMYSLSSCKLFWDAALDTKALLAWSEDTAVLAFRGTASLTNACSNLKVMTWPRFASVCSCREYTLRLQKALGMLCPHVHNSRADRLYLTACEYPNIHILGTCSLTRMRESRL